jgi:hypothetical protein
MAEARDAQHAVQLLLDPISDFSSVTAQYIGRCKGGSCSQTGPQTQKVLLDRPPPTLALKNGFETTGDLGFLKGLFGDLDLRFHIMTLTGLQVIQTRYIFWACIIFKGGNHFLVCINRAARFSGLDLILYDGIKQKGVISQIKGPLENFLKQNQYGISIPIYVRQS